MESRTTLLVPSANEFVPGQYQNSGRDTGAPSLQAGSELSSKASEWVPGSTFSAGNGGLNSLQDVSYALPSGEGANFGNDDTSEQMVEVYWNGSSIFVPESATYVNDDGNRVYIGGEEEVGASGLQILAGDVLQAEGVLSAEHSIPEIDGLQWADGSTTLPAPPKRSLQTIGIPEPIRSHFRNLDIEALRQMDPANERYRELPSRYHSAYPLFNPHSSPAATVAMGAGGSCFGYPSALYKATDQADSQLYALRRFDNVRTAPSVVATTAERWQGVRHPGIVSLYGVMLEKGALFFSYMYHAGSQSLKERFIDQRGPLLGESLIWRLLIQLLSAIRHVHGRGFSVRVVDVAHIILTSGTCARFSTVGVLDVLEFETRKSVAELQQDDLIKLGRVVLSLMTRAVITAKNTEDATALMKQNFSQDLQRVVLALLSGKVNINQLCTNPLVSDRIHEELDTAMAAADALHSHLRSEYENGRMLRLMMKLGFVNERPADHNPMQPHWSETGDQYVLKLFRDHVFHQVDNDGLPILDAGHVLTALNKLDAGDPEEILLSSRDGKDLLVVSYADVQRCLESSFLELSQQSQVALSNAASQVSSSSLPHGLPTGPSGNMSGMGSGGNSSGGSGRYGASASRGASGVGGYGQNNNSTGGIASGRNSSRHSSSSSNLTAMSGNSAGGLNQPPQHSNGRGYSSVGTNLSALGASQSSYTGNNPYTAHNMYNNNASQQQGQGQGQGQGQAYYNSESNQYGGSAGYSNPAGGYTSAGNSGRYNNYAGGGYGGNY